MPIEDNPHNEMLAEQCKSARVNVAGSLPVDINCSRFAGTDGVSEFHYILRPIRYASLADQLDWLEAALELSLQAAGLPATAVAFRRFYCSDLPNQAAEFKSRRFARKDHAQGAISFVNQPPQAPAKVSLWVYCIHDPHTPNKGRHSGHSFSLKRHELKHVWTTGLTAPASDGAYGQTRRILHDYAEEIQRDGMEIRTNLIRTWLLVKDVDSNYPGLVIARNEVFAEHGLTRDTHFVASTGIEGSHADVRAKVLMDAYAIRGIRPEQVTYLQALSHLNPTHEYGVAFERATAVTYRDRRHVYISGTASIDEKGEILHRGNVLRQLDRVFENISALLATTGATLEDMQCFIVYVRDASDAGIVRTMMQERIGDKPFEILTAAVCRPAWLVEIEGVACLPNRDSRLPAF